MDDIQYSTSSEVKFDGQGRRPMIVSYPGCVLIMLYRKTGTEGGMGLPLS